MNKRIIYNYYLKTRRSSIFISIQIYKNILFFYKYDNNEIEQFNTSEYKIKGKDIIFDKNIFSNEKIIYEDKIVIEFSRKNKNMFNNKINISNYKGVINNEEESSLIYFDTEKSNRIPLEYEKIIYISEKNDVIFSATVSEYLDSSKIQLYLDVNGSVIKDNNHISYRNDDELIIKTYQYIYKIHREKNIRNNDCLYSFENKCVSLKIKKIFKEPFINIENVNMLVISYKI